MSSIWGENLRLAIFGESHGSAIGAVLDGLPAGEKIDMDEVLFQMARRAPGKDSLSTKRTEYDIPEIQSGYFQGLTTGTPLCALIRNNDIRSADYSGINDVPRPGHADYTGFVRYGGFNDYRGGGHFSGRLTAPMVFAGAVCRQILSRRGIEVGAHLFSLAGVCGGHFDPSDIPPELLRALAAKRFPVLRAEDEKPMREAIRQAAQQGDSVGGIVECAAAGLPAGLGDPLFGGVENRLSSILFGIPAVRGIEFGAGFSAASMRGSEHNDAFVIRDGKVCTKTNHHGGVLGGITSAMPLLFRIAFKPTPSIFQKQGSVDLHTMKNTQTQIHGRHDPCVAVRAVPVVESLTAVCLLDILLGSRLSFPHSR